MWTRIVDPSPTTRTAASTTSARSHQWRCSRRTPDSIARRVEQVAHEPLQPGALAGDRPEESVGRRGVPGEVGLEQRRGVALDGGERRAELVAERRQELALDGLRAPQGGGLAAGVLEGLALHGQRERAGGVVEQLQRVAGRCVACRQVGHEHRPALGVPEGDRGQVGLDEPRAAPPSSVGEDALGPPSGTGARTGRGVAASSPSCITRGSSSPSCSISTPTAAAPEGPAQRQQRHAQATVHPVGPGQRLEHPRNDSRMRLRRETSASSRSLFDGRRHVAEVEPRQLELRRLGPADRGGEAGHRAQHAVGSDDRRGPLAADARRGRRSAVAARAPGGWTGPRRRRPRPPPRPAPRSPPASPSSSRSLTSSSGAGSPTAARAAQHAASPPSGASSRCTQSIS